MYLTSDAWKAGCMDDTDRYGVHDTYVNTAHWGKRPVDRSYSLAPFIKVKKSYKLFFGENKEGLKITAKSKVMEAHRHVNKEQQFVTLIYHKAGAFTFRVTKARNLEKKATYEGQCKGTTFAADIMWEEMGTKFTGSGKDKNQKEFEIKGEVDPEGDHATEGNSVSGFIMKEKEQFDLQFDGFTYNKEGAITLYGDYG